MTVLGVRSVAVAAFMVVAIGAAVGPGAIAAGIRTTIDGLGRTVVPGLGAGSVAVVRVGGAVGLITAVPTSGGRPRFAVAPILGLCAIAACVATTTMRPAARVGASMPFAAVRSGFAGLPVWLAARVAASAAFAGSFGCQLGESRIATPVGGFDRLPRQALDVAQQGALVVGAERDGEPSAPARAVRPMRWT